MCVRECVVVSFLVYTEEVENTAFCGHERSLTV